MPRARAEAEAKKLANYFEKAKSDAKAREEKAKQLDEQAAVSRLKMAKVFLERFGKEDAITKLEEIITKYPTAKSAKEARELLEKLKKGK